MEKCIIQCIGKYLEYSGVDDVLTSSKVFGSGVVTKVLDGGHYVRGSWGLAIYSELMQRLRLKAFFMQHKFTEYPRLLENIEILQNQFTGKINHKTLNLSYKNAISALG